MTMNHKHLSKFVAWFICFLATIGLVALAVRACNRQTIPELNPPEVVDGGSETLKISDLTFRPPTHFGITGGLPDGGGVFPNHVSGDDFLYFGAGIDGPLSVLPNDAGSCGAIAPMQRDMYYSNVSGSCPINTNNYHLYVSGTLDLSTGLTIGLGSSLALAGTNGADGGGVVPAIGGAGGIPVAQGALPGGTAGFPGGAGAVGRGADGVSALSGKANGGGSLASGAGGAATGGVGGGQSNPSLATVAPFFTFTPWQIIGYDSDAAAFPYGGLGGGGGGGGGGNTANSGGSGAGGGAGAGEIWISAAVINTSSSTAANTIGVTTGGAGGIGGSGFSAINSCGGGGGASGGGGPSIYVVYGQRTGPVVSNLLNSTGGAGGNGGSSIGTSSGAVSGNGGGGGNSGIIFYLNATAQIGQYFPSVAGTAGTAGSGTTAGTGGMGGVNQQSF
jgi:hypothetical protein